jgi:hypothetical protein
LKYQILNQDQVLVQKKIIIYKLWENEDYKHWISLNNLNYMQKIDIILYINFIFAYHLHHKQYNTIFIFISLIICIIKKY